MNHNVARTLGAMLERNAFYFGDDPAIFNDDVTLSHRQYFDRCRSIADGLAWRGIARQDRVAFLMPNGIDAICLYGAAEIGGFIVVPLNWRLSPKEVAEIVADCQPKVLVFDSRFAELAQTLSGQMPADAIIISASGNEAFAEPLAALLAEPCSDGPAVRAEPDDIVYLIYTSGSTGRPKGVMLDQKGQLAANQLTAAEMRLTATDRMLVSMPLFHVGAKLYQGAANLCGAPTFVAEKFVPVDIIRAIEKHRITTVPLVPTMVESLLNEPLIDSADLKSLRMILYTAAAMPGPVIRAGVAKLGPRFMQMYGQTENLGGASLYPHHHAVGGERGEYLLSTVGQAGLFSCIKIVDQDDAEVPDGTAGEIMLKSAGIMRGYWNNSVATAETLRDGWVRTGDIGVLDDRGFLSVVGRRKEMIISGGENIFAGEVEEALLKHAAVAQAAVFGIPDPKWGEAVKACVVLKAEAGINELIEHCLSLIANYKKPRVIEIFDSLPKNAIGKIDKKLLRELHVANG